MSPDTVSSLFPDRPIRPLPKRRLRERLSPEVANSIKYPPSTLNSVPLFQYPPYTVKDDASPPGTGPTSPSELSRRNDPPRNYTPRRNGVGGALGLEIDPSSRSAPVSRSSPEIFHRAGGRSARPESRQTNFQPPPSAASSVDGYESFENMSNKKKRKIPSAGDSALNSAHALNTDMNSHLVQGSVHSMGDLNGERPYHNGAGYAGPGSLASNNNGISGSGRGRLGRSRNGRSPLRALSDGNNTWIGRPAKGNSPHWPSPGYEGTGTGIISNAIANAGKHPPQGQENVSLLQQHSSVTKPMPASTQFTFTCDSQVPGTLQWPGHTTRSNMGAAHSVGVPPGNPPPPPQDTLGKVPGRGSRRKARRRLEKELDEAARDRQQMQEENNRQNPPKKEEVWICEFCEYEGIFGQKPRALIRQYELKDRRARQQEADRKRLLEKAKAKGRKAKKGGKTTAGKGQSSGNHQLDEQVDGQDTSPVEQSHGHSTQSEDDYVEDYATKDDRGPASPSPRPPSGGAVDEGGGGTRPSQGLPQDT